MGFLYIPRVPTKIIDAWNGWYHINGNTYGTWIRGDTRGWRARHHREHVEGDYKNPPPPERDVHLRVQSLRGMDAPVRLSVEARSLLCSAFVASFQHQQTELIAACVTGTHFHLLARFVLPANPRPKPPTRNQPIYAHIRAIVGQVKSHATLKVSKASLATPGGVWAKRCKITAIADRTHQLTVFRYIEKHTNQGGAVWTIRQST